MYALYTGNTTNNNKDIKTLDFLTGFYSPFRKSQKTNSTRKLNNVLRVTVYRGQNLCT